MNQDGTLESIWQLLSWREKRKANPGDIPHDDILLPDLGFETKKIVKLSFYKEDYALALRILGRLKDVAGSKRRVVWHFFEDGKERLVVTKEDDPEKLKKREELKKKKAESKKRKSPYERRGA